MTVSKSSALLRQCGLTVRAGRLYFLAAHFKWTQRSGGHNRRQQALVAEVPEEVAGHEDQPELRKKQRGARKVYEEMKRTEYTNTILGGSTSMKFFVPVAHLLNVAVRGYPRTDRKALQGKARQKRLQRHQFRHFVAAHIGKCQGKAKDCIHPGHICWRLKRKDIHDKNTWKATKSLQSGALVRATYPKSTAIRGSIARSKRCAKRARNTAREQEEHDLEADGFTECAFVDNEAEEAGQARGPPSPTTFKARDRAEEDQRRGWSGCALRDVIADLVDQKLLPSNDPYVKQVGVINDTYVRYARLHSA